MSARTALEPALALALLLAFSPPAAAAPPTAAPAPVSVQSWVLDNGLNVVFAARQGAPLVNVQIVYHVGSRDEKAGQEGLGRVLRDLMFRGSARVPPGVHSRLVARVGGRATSTGDEDVTAFSNTVPAPYLGMVLALEADRMRGLQLWPESVDAVKQAAQAARARQTEESAVGKAVALLRAQIFARHPYARGVAGTAAGLRGLSAADVRAFYDTYFVPSNATLIVTGAATAQEVRRQVAEAFGAIAASDPAAHPESPQPTPATSRNLRLPIELPMVAVGAALPRMNIADEAATRVLAELLAGGSAGLLNQRLVGANLPALAAGGAPAFWADGGLLVLFAVHDPQRTSEEVRRALLDLLASLRQAPLDDDVLVPARLAAAAQAGARLTTAEGLGQELARAAVVEGDPQRALLRPQQLLDVTPSDIGRVANRYLSEDKLSVLMLTPESGGRKAAP